MKLIRWAAALLALLLLIVLSLPFLVDANRFRPLLETRLSAALGRAVKVGNLKLSVFSGAVTADDLSIAGDPAFSPAPLLEAKSLHVGIQLMPLLLHRQLIVTAVTIDKPSVTLLQNAAGEWNTPHSSTASAAPEAAPSSRDEALNLTVQLLRVTDGHLSIGRTSGHRKPLLLDHMNLEVHDFATSSAFPITFSAALPGGGTIKLDCKAGPLNSADLMMTPVAFTLKTDHVDLAASGLNELAPDVAGIVSLTGSGSSTGQQAHIEGSLTADRLKLSKTGTPARRTVQLDFVADPDLRHHSGVLRRGDVHIGKALSHVTGSYSEQADSMLLKMSFTGPEMAVEELVEMLPPMGIVLPNGSSLRGGTMTAAFAMEGPADRLVTTGSVTVTKTRLAGFDIGKRLSVIERLAGFNAGPDTEIETFSATVHAAPDGITTESMKLVVPSIGELSGRGTVSPSNRLAFQMSANTHLTGAVPFRVEGTCANPEFKPDLKALITEKAKDVQGAATDLVKGLLHRKK